MITTAVTADIALLRYDALSRNFQERTAWVGIVGLGLPHAGKYAAAQYSATGIKVTQ